MAASPAAKYREPTGSIVPGSTLARRCCSARWPALGSLGPSPGFVNIRPNIGSSGLSENPSFRFWPSPQPSMLASFEGACTGRVSFALPRSGPLSAIALHVGRHRQACSDFNLCMCNSARVLRGSVVCGSPHRKPKDELIEAYICARTRCSVTCSTSGLAGCSKPGAEKPHSVQLSVLIDLARSTWTHV